MSGMINPALHPACGCSGKIAGQKTRYAALPPRVTACIPAGSRLAPLQVKPAQSTVAHGLGGQGRFGRRRAGQRGSPSASGLGIFKAKMPYFRVRHSLPESAAKHWIRAWVPWRPWPLACIMR